MSDLDERTIRTCIEALPTESIPTMDQPWAAAWNACRDDARKRLKALLPDPVEKLAKEIDNHVVLHGRYGAREIAEYLTQNYMMEKK